MSVKGRKARLAVTAGLAAALALGGVVAPVAQAYADSGYSVTVKAPDDSAYAVDGEYKIYQLFTGTFGGTENKRLGNVAANLTYRDAVLTALNSVLPADQKIEKSDKSDARIAIAITDAIQGLTPPEQQKFANKLAGALANSEATATVNATDGKVVFSGVEPGYYLIASSSTSGATTSAILVPVNGDVTAETKVSTPTVTKQVKVNDEGYKKNTDVGLTSATTVEKLTYKLEGTVASNIDDYGAYKYVFKDTLPKGVTADAVRVAQWNVTCKVVYDGAEHTIPEGRFAVSSATNSTDNTTEISWTCADLAAAMNAAGLSSNHGDAHIILEYTPNYTAEELRNALPNAGMASVNNKVKLEYSNNPYSGSEGSTGTTTTDESKVYTYKLSLSKVRAGANNTTSPLPGAKFTLKRGETSIFADQEVGTDGTLAFTGLDSDVEYELSETTVPAGMKSIDPIKFKITATKNDATGEVTNVKVNTGDVTDNSRAATFDADDKFDDNVIHVTVTNIEGADLPLTGQQGIVAGVAVGGFVLTVSLVAISRNRKRSE